VVAVTHREDVTADLLVLAARRRGVPFYRFNTEDYPSSIGLVLDPSHPDETCLTTPSGEVSLGLARGIWIRRPRWPEIGREVEGRLDRLFARQEAVAAIGGAWRALASACVSPPDVLQAARWKVPQMTLASGLGFSVPETLVTTDPARARTFVSGGRTILKAVAEARVQIGDEESVGNTVEIDDTFDLEQVRPTPVLLQRRVDKVADIRVTAVGHRLFSVRIVTPKGAPLDFRLTDPHMCRFEVVDLPSAVTVALVAYLDNWGLRFGAFDLAEDAEGRLWFLECNPAGQWAWMEGPTGLDITGALLDLLLDPREGAA
jgi:hypothetical protein